MQNTVLAAYVNNDDGTYQPAHSRSDQASSAIFVYTITLPNIPFLNLLCVVETCNVFLVYSKTCVREPPSRLTLNSG